MRRHLRLFALLACITATSAIGAHIAAADTGSNADQACGDQQGHKGHHGKRGHHFFQKLAKELGLSDQQKAQAKAILQKSREENKPYFTALMNERHQMRSLVMSGTVDEAAIRAESAKVASAEADLAVQRAKQAKRLLALLTPDQVTKLRAIQDKREQKFRSFMSCEEPPMQ